MANHVKIINTPNLDESLTSNLLGQAIKAKRTQAKLRLEDAAALCGIAKQTLMQIEHGHASTQLNTILQVCSALGIQLAILPWSNEGDAENGW